MLITDGMKEDAEDLYQNAPFGYLTIQGDGLIINVNATLLGWLCYERDEVLFQKSFQDLLGVGDKIYYETHIMPLLQMQSEISEINIELKGKDSIKLPVLINAKRFVGKQNSLPFFRFSILDITQRKLYELELKKAKKEAEVSVQQLNDVKKELENFATVAAHDLKAPLRSIKGLLGIIQKKGDKMDDVKKQEYFNVVINAAEDMHKLIDNLLEYSKAGIVQEEMQEVELANVFKSQLYYFEEEINKLDGKFSLKCIVKNMIVYPGLFKRLLSNLISSAIKFRSKSSPIIQIGCNEEEEHILFSIKDNGIGIPNNQFENIFNIFKSLKPDKESNGIGLSVCKKIVELHGGRIWLESTVGQGTIFYFTIAKTKKSKHEQYH